MKTIEQLQAAVDELRSVCEKHGIILLGTCASEDIFGEISISEAVGSASKWPFLARQLDNKVTPWMGGFALGGIGSLRPEEPN